MSHKWDKRFMEMAEVAASWSKDPSTKCGAVIANACNRFISQGFNGFPKGIKDDNTLMNREVKYEKIIHAEINAILFAKKDISGCTIYTTFFPCSRCMSVIIQSGITRIVTKQFTKEQAERWGESISISSDMAKQAGILIQFIEKEK